MGSGDGFMSELRSALNEPASEQTWLKVRVFVAFAPANFSQEAAKSYISSHLARWPAALSQRASQWLESIWPQAQLDANDQLAKSRVLLTASPQIVSDAWLEANGDGPGAPSP